MVKHSSIFGVFGKRYIKTRYEPYSFFTSTRNIITDSITFVMVPLTIGNKQGFFDVLSTIFTSLRLIHDGTKVDWRSGLSFFYRKIQ